ncbi:LacI family DNA-binding transcriptional regulator [Gorillibacterium timonense]|uniref:LacI family DNA-binding transcriptional regulator n=1 Tax=Gorillibacterium timonense TaxID=1689269 RepID=UPI00071E5DD9|nr:LacI family DNA-binding transcriptional regulator [Gorillibacterium timonense]
MRGKVTIQQIADLTGVSKFAVSRALSGKSGVSSQTREMILRAAGQLGYFKTRSLSEEAERVQPESREGTGTILVLFPNIRYQNKDSLYWGPLFDGISARLNQKGRDILTLTEPSGDRLFTLLNPEAIQGIVTVGSISTPILLEIKRLNIPVVMVDHLDPAFHCDMVFTDNLSCMRELMIKLISRGYKNYQFIGNIRDAQSYYERWITFRATLEEFDIPLKQIPVLISPEMEDIHKRLPGIIEEHGLPEVFVCVNDTVASFVIEIMKWIGVDVPGQVAVTGFDNTYESLPILATVNVNEELLGRRAVDLLLWRNRNRTTSFEKLLIQADVMVREAYSLTRETVS